MVGPASATESSTILQQDKYIGTQFSLVEGEDPFDFVCLALLVSSIQFLFQRIAVFRRVLASHLAEDHEGHRVHGLPTVLEKIPGPQLLRFLRCAMNWWVPAGRQLTPDRRPCRLVCERWLESRPLWSFAVYLSSEIGQRETVSSMSQR